MRDLSKNSDQCGQRTSTVKSVDYEFVPAADSDTSLTAV